MILLCRNHSEQLQRVGSAVVEELINTGAPQIGKSQSRAIVLGGCLRRAVCAEQYRQRGCCACRQFLVDIDVQRSERASRTERRQGESHRRCAH